MKKFLFLIALFTLMGGVNSYATRKYADLSADVSLEHVTWTALTHTLSWNLSYSNAITLSGFSGDLSSFETLTINASGYSSGNEYRLIFYGPNFPLDGSEHKKVLGAFYSNGGTYNLADRGFTEEMLSNVERVTLAGASSSGSIVIERIYFEKPTEFTFNDAGKAYLYPSDLTASAYGLDSYDPETGIVTKSTTGYGNISFSFGDAGYDFSNITNIEISIDGGYDDIRDYSYVKDLNNHTQYISATGGAYSLGGEIDSNIKEWSLGLNSKTGSMKINYICFTSNVLNACLGEESSIRSLPIYHWDGSAWQTSGYTPSYRVNESTNAAYYGVDWSGENCQNYSDVEGYKAIRIYSAQGNTPRAMFFKSDASGQQQFDFTWNAEGGYYELLLSAVYASVGNYKLISVRPQSGSTSSIKGIYIIENSPIYDYKISGNGLVTSKVTEALADATATSYDATGVTGTGVDFTSVANPNALFVANAGVLANTKNVIVDDVCANLVLTDGNYPFKAPADFTASIVSYDREFTEDVSSTVCLPFALTEDDLDEVDGSFYDLTGVSALGDDFTYSLIEAGTTAYRPYVFEPEDDGALFTGFTNKLIPATPSTLTGATFGGYTMTGVLAGSSDVAADHEGKTVYGWSGNDGNEGVLVKVGTGVAINPFRAYVVYDGVSSLARIAARFVGDKVTGINEVSETQNVLNPDRKYIENNNIVIVKNGVKFNAAGQLLK